MSSDDKADRDGRRVTTTIVGGRVVSEVLADAINAKAASKPKTPWAKCGGQSGKDLGDCVEKNPDHFGASPESDEGEPVSPATTKDDFGLVIIEGSYGTAGEGMDSLFEELTTPWGKKTQPLGPIIEGALAADADDDE